MSSLKRAISRIPGATGVYRRLRAAIPEEATKRVFANPRQFQTLLFKRGTGQSVVKTRSGLEILVRQNTWDAKILKETFLQQPYMRHYTPSENPTVIDVGGYIGDFTLYVASELGARVVVFEPTDENHAILRQNIDRNKLGDRVDVLHMAASPGGKVSLNVSTHGQEIHSSAYWYEGAERREVEGMSIEAACDKFGLGPIDLLKIDCEGGEYDIIPALSDEVLGQTRHIVFEWHEMPGYEAKLKACIDRLEQAGFTTVQEDLYIFAKR